MDDGATRAIQPDARASWPIHGRCVGVARAHLAHAFAYSQRRGGEFGSDGIAGARIVRSSRAGGICGDDMEAWVGIEPAYADLQSAA